MKQKYFRLIMLLALVACMVAFGSVEAFALTESEVQDHVNAVGKETVTGNILVWFLCAVAFLKVSQKIDSFMSSLGINVGHTGGSMLGEMMIIARGVASAAQGAYKSFRGGTAHSSGGGFFSGGLAGVIGRKVERTAIQNATGAKEGGLGGIAFNSSLNKQGGFANNIIGKVATGSVANTGMISGATASQAFISYMGYTVNDEADVNAPSYTNVEIGGGHIFANEVSESNPEGIPFAMYHTDQYMAPEGEYTTVQAVDGTSWYKQYAANTVESKPIVGENGAISYQESIVKKLPPVPKRKDRI